jgi:hypothetical protein
MRGKLPGIICAVLAQCAAALIAATLSPPALAQNSTPQSRARRTSQPSAHTSQPSAGSPRERTQTSESRARTRAAQTQTQRAGGQASRMGEADAQSDISITARVTADSLRFEKVPNPRVEFTGQPRRETVWEAEREHLPQQVQPGVSYRNVGITLRITSVFADIDRIVAEALGEVPPSDDAQPVPTPPQQPNADNPQASSSPTTEATQTLAPTPHAASTQQSHTASTQQLHTASTQELRTASTQEPRATSTRGTAQAPATAGTTPRRGLTHKGRVN